MVIKLSYYLYFNELIKLIILPRIVPRLSIESLTFCDTTKANLVENAAEPECRTGEFGIRQIA